MRAVHFGAGNIGRGFIGLLLSRSGFEVCFVDVNETLVSLLQQRRQYEVTLANGRNESTIVQGVTAIDGSLKEQVAEAVKAADFVTTAVGVSVLKHIAEPIARGIELRLTEHRSPLHIIACENAIGGSSQLKEHVYAHLRADLRQEADQWIAFPNAAVDRIVPIQHHEDPLKVTVEPFYEWVVDRSATMEGFPEITGVHYVEDLEPYIERKLFTVNTGHCSAAYHGYLKGHATIQAAMADPLIHNEVGEVLRETGETLIRKYGFDRTQHEAYIHKIVERFVNPYLKDEVERVGRSPIRKLSPNDRLVRPALLAFELGVGVSHLASVMAAALLFDSKKDPEAAELQEVITSRGIHEAIATVTGLLEDHPIHGLVVQRYEEMRRRNKTKGPLQ